MLSTEYFSGALALYLFSAAVDFTGFCRRAGARHAAARAGHALQQVAVQLACLGQHQHFFAFLQALGGHHLYLAVRVHLVDGVHHRVRHAAGNRKPAAVGGGLHQLGPSGHFGELDGLRLKHAHHFFKCEHEVHVAADGAAAGFQLFGGARPDENDLAVFVLFFQQAGRQHHGRHGHGDIGRKIREQLFRHHAPGRAAGRGHERLLLGHLAHKILGFFNGTQVRADGDLHHIVKAQELHGWLQLFRRHVRAELAHKGRSHGGDDTVALVDGLDDLEDLAFVRDGAERTVYKAHAAGHALVVIDLRAAQLVGADGIHAAGLGAGAFHLMDGAVGAYVGAAART